MSNFGARLAARLDRWLDRLTADDDRYLCGVCDDRFHGRADGIEHLRRCHPQFQRILVLDSDQAVVEPSWIIPPAPAPAFA